MELDRIGTLVAVSYGVLGRYGNCYAIMQGETVLHRGSIGYIRTKWQKLTGKKMHN